jgi:hypothetical protein
VNLKVVEVIVDGVFLHFCFNHQNYVIVFLKKTSLCDYFFFKFDRQFWELMNASYSSVNS